MTLQISTEVVIYKGYELLAEGTVNECAAQLNVKPNTIRFYLTPAYQRRLAKRKTLENSLTATRINDDEEE